MGVVMLAALVFVPPYLAGMQNAAAAFRATFKCLIRDPVFYLGLAFMTLLAVQWFNAGRPLVLDQTQNRWLYSQPGIPFLPSAFTESEAMEMITWFLPAWALVLILRSPWMDYDMFYSLWRMMALNSALLALFGIVQLASGTTDIYWMIPAKYIHFASFGYPNHAGAYFTLMLCLSGGLLLRETFARDKPVLNGAILLWLACSILDLAAATLSFSRAATVFSWTVTVAMCVYAIRKWWHVVNPAARLNLVVSIGGALFLACFAAIAFGKEKLVEKMSKLIPSITILPDSAGASRIMVITAALEAWKDSPWFGVGGAGFRYLAASHLPGRAIEKTAGLANVHNDPVQFLLEFGLVGIGLMVLIIFVLARPLFRGRVSRRPALLFAAAGVFIVLLQSLIDLPFRCPAIIYAWLAMLTLVGRLCELAVRDRQRKYTEVLASVDPDEQAVKNWKQ